MTKSQLTSEMALKAIEARIRAIQVLHKSHPEISLSDMTDVFLALSK